MSQSEAVERIIARHGEDVAVAVAVIVAWAKSEQDRLEHANMMLCDVCTGPFFEGELMLKVPAIGWMHQDCDSGFVLDEGEDG